MLTFLPIVFYTVPKPLKIFFDANFSWNEDLKTSTRSNSLRNPYNSVFHPFDGELWRAHALGAGYLP